jgi:hypothetical protein
VLRLLHKLNIGYNLSTLKKQNLTAVIQGENKNEAYLCANLLANLGYKNYVYLMVLLGIMIFSHILTQIWEKH